MTDVIVEREGTLGRLRLNRPATINALTLGMVRTIGASLDRWAGDPTLGAVLLTGEGSRGLCAGGDIRAFYDLPRTTDSPALSFWREEYRLDARIADWPTAFVAVMEGLVMGGGLGLSAHAGCRIVTESTRVAFPECGIGLVPDVGATWLLPRAPGKLGTFMALTGRALGAADALHLGLADMFVPAEHLPQIAPLLADLPAGATSADVRRALQTITADPGPPQLAGERHWVDRAFDADRVDDIIARLSTEPGAEPARALADLRAKSPTALKLALRLARRGAGLRSLRAALELEYAACRAMFLGHDFREGIRAAVIDKDRAPRWQPATLAEVADACVDAALSLTDDRVFGPEEVQE